MAEMDLVIFNIITNFVTTIVWFLAAGFILRKLSKQKKETGNIDLQKLLLASCLATGGYLFLLELIAELPPDPLEIIQLGIALGLIVPPNLHAFGIGVGILVTCSTMLIITSFFREKKMYLLIPPVLTIVMFIINAVVAPAPPNPGPLALYFLIFQIADIIFYVYASYKLKNNGLLMMTIVSIMGLLLVQLYSTVLTTGDNYGTLIFKLCVAAVIVLYMLGHFMIFKEEGKPTKG